ncbi:MAG: segregation/condensation protein A [Oscillospiraceae bacterium]|nr:segregation/condensation protein A [Oscillospiraceae bacterium]
MEVPVYRLEGVVKSKSDMSDFEGPLTLILTLLSRNRIEIRDISISLILEQYLEHLGTMTEKDLETASEFVAMASHLAYIKTRMLLSSDEEISEIDELISSLERLQRGEEYVQIKDAALALSEMYTRGAALIASPPEYLPDPKQLGYVHVGNELLSAMVNLINREGAYLRSINESTDVYPQREEYAIPDKISHVLQRLKTHSHVSLATLFKESRNRSELIATLVAILELCRVGSVFLTGEQSDVYVSLTVADCNNTLSDF